MLVLQKRRYYIKYRCYPNEMQKDFFRRVFGSYRYSYNFAMKYYEYLEANNLPIPKGLPMRTLLGNDMWIANAISHTASVAASNNFLHGRRKLLKKKSNKQRCWIKNIHGTKIGKYKAKAKKGFAYIRLFNAHFTIREHIPIPDKIGSALITKYKNKYWITVTTDPPPLTTPTKDTIYICSTSNYFILTSEGWGYEPLCYDYNEWNRKTDLFHKISNELKQYRKIFYVESTDKDWERFLRMLEKKRPISPISPPCSICGSKAILQCSLCGNTIDEINTEHWILSVGSTL